MTDDNAGYSDAFWRDAERKLPEPTPPTETQPDDLIRERSRKAALELLSFLAIQFPRGKNFTNTMEQTIAICIEQNMRGNHR